MKLFENLQIIFTFFSVVDLRERISDQFLPQLIRSSSSSECRVLLASHGLFLQELNSLLKDKAKDKTNMEKTGVYWDNTAVSEYCISVGDDEQINDVECSLFACNKHVQ